MKKPLISARISHFSCKIIDFGVNFYYFLVYLHVEKTNSCMVVRNVGVSCLFPETMKIGCTIGLYFCA